MLTSRYIGASLLVGAALFGCDSPGEGTSQIQADASDVVDASVSDAADVSDADLSAPADMGPDAAPPIPTSPWIAPWGDCEGSIRRTPGSFNSLVGVDLSVAQEEPGRLTMTVSGLYEPQGRTPCLQTWTDEGDTATLELPLACSENWTGGTITWEAGGATLDAPTIALEMTGTETYRGGEPDSAVVLTLSCISCPPEPCPGRCEAGACCGGDAEMCCGNRWCADGLECFDGMCSTCGGDGEACCPGASWDQCADGLDCNRGRGGDSGTCGPIVCGSNPCSDAGLGSGYFCDADTQRRCTTTTDGCQVESNGAAAVCEPGQCDAATGTCNGCDLSNECAGLPEGVKLCGGGNGPTEQICGQVDGCDAVVDTNACPSSCLIGSGCCYDEGLPCCNGQTPACAAGLSCVDGLCSP
ncbi:MAG: hypothetical protein ACI9U2_001524 [Bradymonadia bacterium]|jgi:hypothetical protein